LLAAVPLDSESVLPVVFSWQTAGSQIGDLRSRAPDEQEGEHKQGEKFLQIQHNGPERYTSVGGL